MSRSAFSVFVFSIYLLLLGLILLIVPNILLSLFGVPETTEIWIRVVGMLVFILGFYYFESSRNEQAAFVRATIFGRSAVLVFFVAFVLLELAPPVLILFGVIDALGATWTGLSLRAEQKPADS